METCGMPVPAAIEDHEPTSLTHSGATKGKSMARVKIMYWRDIPYAVRAFDDNGQCSKQLPQPFEATVDNAAMAAGMTEQDDYHEGFNWSEEKYQEGSADDAAAKVHDEIVEAYPSSRLASLVRKHRLK